MSRLARTYALTVPRLWEQTIDAHRRAVSDAILRTTAALVAEHGLRSVTMSQIAQETGIGRATLYKYFPDVQTILRAWHERQIAAHLEQLAEYRDRPGPAGERLEAVLRAYAVMAHESRGHHEAELEALLHRDAHVDAGRRKVCEMLRDLLAEGAKQGEIRADVAPEELATYCVHALSAAQGLRSQAAIQRLVKVTMAALAPTPDGRDRDRATESDRLLR